MRHACGRLGENGRVNGQTFGVENLPDWRDHVLGERPRTVGSHSGQLVAQDLPAGATVVADPAAGVGVDGDRLAEGEVGNAFTNAILTGQAENPTPAEDVVAVRWIEAVAESSTNGGREVQL